MSHIQLAYDFAKLSGSYVSSIQLIFPGCYTTECEICDYIRTDSRSESAYAMTDRFEYFAEATESFLGLNDYYPFNGNQLREMDLGGYNMIISTYGLPSNYYPRTPLQTTSGADSWQTPVQIKFTNDDLYCNVDVFLVTSSGTEEKISTVKPGEQFIKSDAKYSQVYLIRRISNGQVQTSYIARQFNVNFKFFCDAKNPLTLE